MKLDIPFRTLALGPVLASSLLIVACGGGGGSESSTGVAAETTVADTTETDVAIETEAIERPADESLTVEEATAAAASNPQALADAAAVPAETASLEGRETAQAARDVLKQPFSNRSIWNMPIGSGASYVHARISTQPRGDTWAPMPAAERDHIVLKPTSPRVNVYHSTAGWSGRNRCSATSSRVLANVPIPHGYIAPTARTNDSAAFLMPDRRTVVQTQPVARCSAGSHATSWTAFPTVDLYGDGIAGAHGGSGLSALGGTLRVGEMRPGAQGPRHALKMVIDAATELRVCSPRAACFRWPARNADSYAATLYGRRGTDAPAGLLMGALLAINKSTNVASMGLETQPGRQLAWTLQNYGAYIVDDTHGAGLSFAVEVGPDGKFEDQFKKDYGFNFAARSRDNTAWARDVKRIVSALHLVSNNAANRVGGGGTPRQSLAAAL